MSNDNAPNSPRLYQKCPNPDCGYESENLAETVCQICHTPFQSRIPTPKKFSQKLKKTQISPALDDQKTKLILGFGSIVLGTMTITLLYFVFQEVSPSLNSPKKTESLPKSSQEFMAQSVEQTTFRIFPLISQVTNVPSGIFNYGGSICFAALVREGLHEKIEQAHPQFQLQYLEPEGNPGCSTEITRLSRRELTFAHNARPLTPEEHQLAQNQGFTLESVPVALDGIAPYISQKSLAPPESLSLPQLRDIYRGEITNWQQVGGTNLPITVITLDPKADPDLPLMMGLAENDASFLRADAKVVRDYTTAIREVSSTLGAISIASTAIIRGQKSIKPIALAKDDDSTPFSALLADGTVNLSAFQLSSYPLTRRLYVAIRLDGTIAEQAGIAYVNFLLSKEGQKSIAQAGFVPLAGKFLL